MLLLLLALAQAQVLTPPPNVELTVGVQALSAIASLYNATPYCYGTPDDPTLTCSPSITARDLKIVKDETAKALVAMKAYPATQRETAAALCQRLSVQLGSVAYERMSLWIHNLQILSGPTVTNGALPRRDGAGNVIKDDQ